jgi:hypothetical protein
MAVMREPPPLLIPNAATDGDNRRLLLLTAVPLTKKELLQTTTEDAVLAIAISGIDNAVPCVFLFVATLYELRVRCNWGGAGVGRGLRFDGTYTVTARYTGQTHTVGSSLFLKHLWRKFAKIGN